ncbi:hypothetical protein Hanom_Chr09g00811671 [Helianthus anomalus]
MKKLNCIKVQTKILTFWAGKFGHCLSINHHSPAKKMTRIHTQNISVIVNDPSHS